MPANTLAEFFNAVTTPILYFMKASCYFGNVLVDAAVIILNFILSIVTALRDFAVVFWDDYTFFTFDLIQSAQYTYSLTSEAFWTLVNQIIYIFQYGNFGIFKTFQLISNGLNEIALIGTFVTSTIWQVLILVYSGFSLIGLSVIGITYTIPKDIIYGIAALPKTISIAIKSSKDDLLKKLSTINFSSSLSLQPSAFFASLLGVVVCWMCFRHWQEIFVFSVHKSRRIFYIVFNIFNQYWTGEFLESRVQFAEPTVEICERQTSRNDSVEAGNCIVCLSAPKNILFMPCRHFCICKSCSDKLNTNNCILCRKRIRNTIQIYT